MSIESGNTYKITNAKSRTILDLSGTDNRTVSGYTDNGGSNQRWTLDQVDGGHWTLRSAATGQYLGIDGPIQDGTPLVSVGDAVHWDIYPDENVGGAYRLYVPDAPTAMNIDLSDFGNETPGTVVTLWSEYKANENQAWYFEQA